MRSSLCECNNPTCPASHHILVHLLSLSPPWWSPLALMPRYVKTYVMPTTATSTSVHLDTGCYTPVHPDTGRYTLVHADTMPRYVKTYVKKDKRSPSTSSSCQLVVLLVWQAAPHCGAFSLSLIAFRLLQLPRVIMYDRRGMLW